MVAKRKQQQSMKEETEIRNKKEIRIRNERIGLDSLCRVRDSLSTPSVRLCAGRPVVLLHGFPMDHTIWGHQAGALARRWSVIAPDLCGAGCSPAPDTVTVGKWADALAAMLEFLMIDEPIVLGGLSMGGYVAFQFFQSYRERLAGLILCDTRAAADTPQAAAGRLETAAVGGAKASVSCPMTCSAIPGPRDSRRQYRSCRTPAADDAAGDPFTMRPRSAAWPNGPTSRRCCRK